MSQQPPELQHLMSQLFSMQIRAPNWPSDLQKPFHTWLSELQPITRYDHVAPYCAQPDLRYDQPAPARPFDVSSELLRHDKLASISIPIPISISISVSTSISISSSQTPQQGTKQESRQSIMHARTQSSNQAIKQITNQSEQHIANHASKQSIMQSCEQSVFEAIK